MAESKRVNLSVAKERAILASVIIPEMMVDMRDPLAELRALTAAAGAVPVDEVTQQRQRPEASTFIGKGKLDEIITLIKAHDAQVLIFDNDLSPAQIRNIEETVSVKVLDRSELILDIFASRARTHEAKLQVELAQLEYTYPRLRAMWSHLERIAGGSPAGIGTRGPGEQQIEIDRRIVNRRKAELRREIDKVQSRKQREVESRHIDYFTVGLVGYTNAGKSTLFNTLTHAEVTAKDMLFATLDTRTRKWTLGGGDQVMLSDTVGFVRDLPHHLVASFRATLEQSITSDLLLIVLDVSDRHAEFHLNTVQEVLEQVDAAKQPHLLLLNKVDLLDDMSVLAMWRQRYPRALVISASQGTGLDQLVEAVRLRHRGQMRRLRIRLPIEDGKAIGLLETRAEILDRQYDNGNVTLEMNIGDRQLNQLRAISGPMDVVDELAYTGPGQGA